MRVVSDKLFLLKVWIKNNCFNGLKDVGGLYLQKKKKKKNVNEVR